MISKQDKDIAKWAIEFALKNGCSASRTAIAVSYNNSFEYRNNQLDKLHQSSENKLYIELYVDGRFGAFSTNRINKDELEYFIKESILSTRFLAKDLCRQLPEPERYYRPSGRDLDLFDNSYYDIETKQKIDLAKSTVEEVYQSDPSIISTVASFDDACSSEYIIASNGFEGETKDTAFSISAEVALKTDGDARPESYWYDSSVYWKDLNKKGIAKKAFNRALGKIGQRKVRSGKYSFVVDNTVSSRLISPLISAMFGSALHQKSSFLLDKLNKKIASDKLTITDSPHIPRSFGSRFFDGEGIATKTRTIIENGELKSYFIDTYNSLKMGIEPTIASPSVLTAKHGELNFEQLIKTMYTGIWITGFNGGNCNPTTGDFSFGIEGFRIENGSVTFPIGEMNITGNMLSLWSKLLEVGNDPRINSSFKIPSLLFLDVNFSGL